MISSVKELGTQLQRAADWTVETPTRWVSITVSYLLLTAGFVAAQIRFTWRKGYADPGSRLEYAVVQGLADLPSTLILAAALVLVYGLYRGIRGEAYAE